MQFMNEEHRLSFEKRIGEQYDHINNKLIIEYRNVKEMQMMYLMLLDEHKRVCAELRGLQAALPVPVAPPLSIESRLRQLEVQMHTLLNP